MWVLQEMHLPVKFKHVLRVFARSQMEMGGIDVHRLNRRSEMIQVNTYHVTEDGLALDGTESAALLELDETTQPPVRAVGDIEYHLMANLVGRDLLVTGSVQISLETQCARCLARMKYPLKASLCLHFEKVAEQEVDLTEDVREELLLAIPQNFHCSEDCKGICTGCGADLNREPCRCEQDKRQEEPPVDPKDSPWAALDDLK